jgi:2-C-methyl-D-erythritol 4-phosphate cytidylyltransferase
VTVGAIVAAAGRGERLGAEVAKALVPVRGEPLVVHAVRMLTDAGIGHVVVCAPPDDCARVDELVGGAAVVVSGGATRSESVRRGLAALPPDVDIVLVHDAARAFMPVDVIRSVVAAVVDGEADAVVPVLPVADTVKEVADGIVVATVDRSRLRAVQTPQGFRREVLAAAHKAAAADDATADAALVEASGRTVVTVPGSPYGLKVTTAFDLAVVEALLGQQVSR